MSTEDSSPTGVGGDGSPASEPESELDEIDQFLIEAIEDDDGQVDDPYVEILAEYVEDIEPVLTNRLQWARTNAKSSMAPFYKYDQSMLAHTRAGVFFLLRFIGDVLPDRFLIGRGTREEVLRELVALFVVHDVHKTRDSDEYHEEFNISEDEIETFVETTGLDEFAPTVDIKTFQSAAVGLHKTDNAKLEMLTKHFSLLKPYLRLADGVASLTDPDEFVSDRLYTNFYDAVADTATPHSHSVDDSAGALTSVMNKALAETFESYGYSLLTIHETGCTYAGPSDADIGTLPADPDEFIDTAYQQFLEELRNALPRYRNRSILADAAELRSGQSRYEISSLDVLCLPPSDLIRAIVERGVTDADAPFDLSNSVTEVLDVLEDETGLDLDRTHRIEGIARIVHTVHESIVPVLMRDSGPDVPRWESNPWVATMAVFDTSNEMIEMMADLYTDHYDPQTGQDALVSRTRDWAYKYLIAQDILDSDEYFVGEGSDETIDRLTDTLVSHLEDFAQWDDFRTSLVGHVDEELRAMLFRALYVDGERFHEVHGAPAKVESYISHDKDTCGLCNSRTVAAQESQPELIEAELYIGGTDNEEKRDIKVEYGGDIVPLQQLCYRERLCFSCQLDVELQAADTSWTDIDEPRLHIALRPDYAYTPLSGIIFTHVLDKYSAASTQRGADFAKDVFLGATAEQESYDEIMAAHAQNAFGRAMLANLERGFMLGSGYGAHSVSFPLPEGNEREALFAGTFAAVVAASYSGISAYISDHPILRVPDDGARELVQFSDALGSVKGAFGGDRLPLHEMNDLLKATSAIRRLAHATGHGHAPVSAYLAYKRNQDIPLVGSEMLTQAVENGEDPADYAVEAIHLDAHAASNSLFEDFLVKDAAALADYAVEVTDYPDDPTVASDLVGTAIDEVVAMGRSVPTERAVERVIEVVEAHDAVDTDAFETIDGFIREFAALLVSRVLNDHHNGVPRSLAAARDPLTTGVWAHAVAVCKTDRDPYEDLC